MIVGQRKIVRVGSRGSVLAIRQAEEVVKKLSQVYDTVGWEIVPIKTTGDLFLDSSPALLSKGMFVKELEGAILEGVVDLAVHSLKDLPVELPTGLALWAVLERDDPRDVLLSRSGLGLATLPPGSRVGTSSARRRVQVEVLRPDLQVVMLRGNVPTRIRKMEEGQVEALVLAAAGLKRLGEDHRIVEYLPGEVFVPAVGQGVIVVEGRKGDSLEEVVTVLHHSETAQAVETERDFLRFFGGGCQTPVGALAVVNDGWMKLLGMAVCQGEVRRALLEGPIEERRQLAQSLAEILRGEDDG